MAWQSGGGGGYPGVTSNGNNGLNVQRGARIGDDTRTDSPDYLWVRGAIEVDDVPASPNDGDVTLAVTQSHPILVAGQAVSAIKVFRAGDISLHDYAEAAVLIEDDSGSLAPLLRVKRGGTEVLSIGVQQSVTGALSTVADAPAKAVLTSIIAALTGIRVAANNTT